MFSFTGALYTQHANRADVVIEQWTPGRDMSDHYGIQASIDTTVELFPLEAARFQRWRSAFVGSRACRRPAVPGDDEVTFTLSAKTARGEMRQLSSLEVKDVSAGAQHDFALAPLRLPDPGDELSLSIAGNEIDDLSANDSLGRTRLVFDRQELLALVAGGSASLAFPVLHGDGGEYVVEFELRIGQ